VEAFDPYECAKYFGIESQLVALPKGLSGRFRFDLQMPTIELNSEQSAKRHRFTVCHEMAHLTFLSDRPALPQECEFFECNLIDKREEELCDRIASVLLMPTDIFKRKVSDITPCYEGLNDIADAFHVSIFAAFHRIKR